MNKDTINKAISEWKSIIFRGACVRVVGVE